MPGMPGRDGKLDESLKDELLEKIDILEGEAAHAHLDLDLPNRRGAHQHDRGRIGDGGARRRSKPTVVGEPPE